MSEDEELLDEEDGEELNWIAIGVAAVALILVIGGGIWYFLIREDPDALVLSQRPQWVEPEGGIREEQIIEMLPRMIISPYDGQGRYFLILKLNFSVGDQNKAMKLVMERPGGLDRIQNFIIDIYSSYTLDELRQPKYKEEARQHLKNELNKMAGWQGIPPELEGLDEDDLPKPPLLDVYYETYILQ